MWRVVGAGVGLQRHDGEVEGVVVKDDAALEFSLFWQIRNDYGPSGCWGQGGTAAPPRGG